MYSPHNWPWSHCYMRTLVRRTQLKIIQPLVCRILNRPHRQGQLHSRHVLHRWKRNHKNKVNYPPILGTYDNLPTICAVFLMLTKLAYLLRRSASAMFPKAIPKIQDVTYGMALIQLFCKYIFKYSFKYKPVRASKTWLFYAWMIGIGSNLIIDYPSTFLISKCSTECMYLGISTKRV